METPALILDDHPRVLARGPGKIGPGAHSGKLSDSR